MGERQWGGLDHGAAFHREIHRMQNERFRNDMLVEHMRTELGMSEPLARSLVFGEPLRIDSPQILIPYANLALPSGDLSTLHIVDFEGKCNRRPVVQGSMGERASMFADLEAEPFEFKPDTDPYEAAERYFELCATSDLTPESETLVMTRHMEQNHRAVSRCRMPTQQTMLYRPRVMGPYGAPNTPQRAIMSS